MRYRVHVLARTQLRSRVPSVLSEDSRPLVQRFRRVFPSLLAHSDLAGTAKEIVNAVAVAFPDVSFADARAIETDECGIVFVTSAMLDAIELFARTVSVCARLNLQALPALAAAEDRPPDTVPLTWLTLTGDGIPGMTVSELLDDPPPSDRLQWELVRYLDFMPRLAPGLGRWKLSHYLMQIMMRAVRRTTAEGWDGIGRYPRDLPPDISPVDGDYLATLTLAYVALHEVGHLLLSHNEIGFRGSTAELAWTAPIVEAAEQLKDEGELVDLRGTGSSFEFAADNFAVGVLDEALHDPLVEAASLWLATLERKRKEPGDRFDDLRRMAQSPDEHPSFALRVWNLNGRFGSEARRGEIAETIATAAEHAAFELDWGRDDRAAVSDEDRAECELRLFADLWRLACRAMVEYDTESWATSDITFDSVRTLSARESDRLERSVRAAAHGVGAVAGEVSAVTLRIVRRAARPLGAAVARALNPARKLEEPNAAEEADAAARDADALLTSVRDRYAMQPRGGSADDDGSRAEGSTEFELGRIAHEAGNLDRAEAQWRRAPADDAEAALGLGQLLEQRGDHAGAEVAYRRAADCNEPIALLHVGSLCEERGELGGAAVAYARAVALGCERAQPSLVAAMAKQRELQRSERTLEAAAQTGDQDAAYELGLVRTHRGDVPGALAALTRAERLGHPQASNELGQVFCALGRDELAEAAFRRGDAHRHARAIFNLSVMLWNRGRDDAAREALERADALGDELAPFNLGRALRLIGDVEGAVAAYARADERKNGPGAAMLGTMLESLGELEESEAAYRRAAERGDHWGAAALGDLLRRRGELGAAEAAWRRADALGSADAAYSLGELLEHFDNRDGAEAALRRAVERGHPKAAQELRLLLGRAGRAEAAEESAAD